MKTIKTRPPMGGTGKATICAAIDAEHSVVDFIARGRRAQGAVDRILEDYTEDERASE